LASVCIRDNGNVAHDSTGAAAKSANCVEKDVLHGRASAKQDPNDRRPSAKFQSGKGREGNKVEEVEDPPV